MNNKAINLFEEAVEVEHRDMRRAIELFDECLCAGPPSWVAMQSYFKLAELIARCHCRGEEESISAVEMKWMQQALDFAKRSLNIYEQILVRRSDLERAFLESVKTEYYSGARQFIEDHKYFGLSFREKLARISDNDPQAFTQEMERTVIPSLKCSERAVVFNDQAIESGAPVESEAVNGHQQTASARPFDRSRPKAPASTLVEQTESMNLNKLKTEQVTEMVSQINHFISSYEWQLAQEENDKKAKLERAEQKYKRTFNELNQVVEENKKSAAKIRQLLQAYENTASEHLKKQRVSSYLSPTMLIPGEQEGNQMEIAQRYTDRAFQLQSKLNLITMPKNLVQIVVVFLAIGLVLGFCGAIGGQSGGIFILSLFFSGGIGLAISGTLWYLAQSAMKKLFAEIRQCRQAGETALENHEKMVLANFTSNEGKAKNLRDQEISRAAADYQKNVGKIVDDAKTISRQTEGKCRAGWEAAGFAGKRWNKEEWQAWQVFERNGGEPNYNVSFGKMTIQTRASGGPQFSFDLPALMSLNGGRGLLFKVPGQLKTQAIGAVQSVMLRLLATLPAGMVRFTMFDPIGLGQNVAAFMPLGKFDDKLITSRAWSEPKHIGEELEKLTMHLQDIIQMRLRNDHKNIEEYNKASKVPEPYRIVVAMDFPTNYSEEAERRLISIAENGARCGVYPIVVVDTDLLAKNSRYNFNLENLAQHLELVAYENGNFVWKNNLLAGWKIEPEALNLNEQPLINQIIGGVGEKAVKAMNVEVPFDDIWGAAPPDLEKLWQSEKTGEGIEIPLGPQTVGEYQSLTVGKTGTAHHAIIIGRTGSGKTNLMDVIITGAALKYSPEEIEFYLIDLKSGVGFKPYADAQLPHARVIAIDSEREFALSVLRGLIEEMLRRGEKFRQYSVENNKDFREKSGEKMPRILLVVDEFQILFLEDDAIARESVSILSRLAEQGRAYGIHVILGSQSLGGKASSLPGATLGQFGIRIALMCSEADARAVMADDNPEARLLSRVGEAIYNDRNGLIEGNKRFQVALFGKESRKKYLNLISHKAKSESLKKPTIFEGNKLAQLEQHEPLKKLLSGDLKINEKRREAWLGEPIKLSELPVAVRFRRQAGNNLLIVAKEEKEGVGMMTAAWLSLALQYQPDAAEFLTLNLTNAEEPWFELIDEIGELLPQRVEKLNRHNLVEKLQNLLAEINLRAAGERGDGKAKFLMIFGLQRAKDLRFEEGGGRFGYSNQEKEPSASDLFAKILREGAEVGVHVLTWCDLAINVKRTLDRKSLNEFNSRVASMMSQDDSQFILDSPAAAKLDRPFRAIFYDEDRPGYLEKFRPFAIPHERDWWLEITKNLSEMSSKAHTI